jgi:hypothetical protein
MGAGMGARSFPYPAHGRTCYVLQPCLLKCLAGPAACEEQAPFNQGDLVCDYRRHAAASATPPFCADAAPCSVVQNTCMLGDMGCQTWGTCAASTHVDHL